MKSAQTVVRAVVFAITLGAAIPAYAVGPIGNLEGPNRAIASISGSDLPSKGSEGLNPAKQTESGTGTAGAGNEQDTVGSSASAPIEPLPLRRNP